MKSLSKFEAFKLDKNQMNAIAGGRIIRCDFGDQSFLYNYNGTLEDARQQLYRNSMEQKSIVMNTINFHKEA